MIKEFYQNKRILITGHTGFKGSWLCSLLIEFGANVCGIGLKPNTQPSLFELLNIHENMDSHILDIRDLEALKKIFNDFQPEIVFHLAAQPLVIDSYNNPSYTYDVNVMGTVNVCECIRLSKSVKSFVNITTDKVYLNNENSQHLYSEEDELNGFDPYSNSKSCSELVTSSYKKSFFENKEISISTCRAGNVIGGGDFSNNRIIPDCVNAALSNRTISVRNKNSVRPYQHVLEANTFYLYLAMKQYDDKSFAGCYNVGPNQSDSITTGELCDKFIQYWGSGLQWESISLEGPHEANYLKLSIDKARRVLGWHPTWDVNEAVRSVVEWSKVYMKKGDICSITKQQIDKYIGESKWI